MHGDRAWCPCTCLFHRGMAQVQWPQHPTRVTDVAGSEEARMQHSGPSLPSKCSCCPTLCAAMVSIFQLPGPAQAQCLRPAVGWAPGQPGLTQRAHSLNSRVTSSTSALFLSMIKKCNKTIEHYSENATTTPRKADKARGNLIVLQVPVALSATLFFRAF